MNAQNLYRLRTRPPRYIVDGVPSSEHRRFRMQGASGSASGDPPPHMPAEPASFPAGPSSRMQGDASTPSGTASLGAGTFRPAAERGRGRGRGQVVPPSLSPRAVPDAEAASGDESSNDGVGQSRRRGEEDDLEAVIAGMQSLQVKINGGRKKHTRQALDLQEAIRKEACELMRVTRVTKGRSTTYGRFPPPPALWEGEKPDPANLTMAWTKTPSHPYNRAVAEIIARSVLDNQEYQHLLVLSPQLNIDGRALKQRSKRPKRVPLDMIVSQMLVSFRRFKEVWQEQQNERLMATAPAAQRLAYEAEQSSAVFLDMGGHCVPAATRFQKVQQIPLGEKVAPAEMSGTKDGDTETKKPGIGDTRSGSGSIASTGILFAWAVTEVDSVADFPKEPPEPAGPAHASLNGPTLDGTPGSIRIFLSVKDHDYCVWVLHPTAGHNEWVKAKPGNGHPNRTVLPGYRLNLRNPRSPSWVTEKTYKEYSAPSKQVLWWMRQ
ncbi:hypothetical protein BKA62DRAFT_778970 [Auriculariales sp. MPI-PUGE-AT-0066]|nr:hypothetical protein BKA62DRAFT_778970 [Auriculariales sp. MPI-PUGE-AT-0066]